MKNTLFVTQYFPPGATVAARRFTQLAVGCDNCFVIRRHQLDEGWLALKGLTVFTISANDLRSHLNKNTVVSSQKKSKTIRYLLSLRQAYPFLYLTDDGGPLYRRKAYQQACEIIQKHGITTVFSSFRPWSDHLVSAKLKRQFPHLRWIADFRDLPVDPVHQNVWWPALQRWWGKRVIREADEVWMVSEGQKVQMNGWHPNIKVKRNALSALPPSESAPRSEHFTIVYTGSLYAGFRTPKQFVAVLQELLAGGHIDENKVRLVYRGKDSTYFRSFTLGLPECILDIQPSIAPAAAHELQASAQLLLLLTWSAPGYYGVLTAKLWEYLGTGRPILALVKGPGDPELKGIIEGANAGAVFSEKEQSEVEKWLRNAYQEWEKEHSLSWSVDVENLKQYL